MPTNKTNSLGKSVYPLQSKQITSLNITDQLTRGAHDFIGKQNDIAENLRELQNQPI